MTFNILGLSKEDSLNLIKKGKCFRCLIDLKTHRKCMWCNAITCYNYDLCRYCISNLEVRHINLVRILRVIESGSGNEAEYSIIKNIIIERLNKAKHFNPEKDWEKILP